MGSVGAACKVSPNGHTGYNDMSFFQLLFGIRETHHDFSSEQLLHDPGQ